MRTFYYTRVSFVPHHLNGLSARLCASLVLAALPLLAVAEDSAPATAEEHPLGEDILILNNGQRLVGSIVGIPQDSDQTIRLQSTSGELELQRWMVARVELSLDKRLEMAHELEDADKLALTRELMAADRKSEAWRLLQSLDLDPRTMPLGDLLLLVRLRDELGDGSDVEELIDLYRLYAERGGKDPAALARLEQLEAAQEDYQASLEDYRRKIDELPPVVDGLEQRQKWRSEDPKYANAVTISHKSRGEGKRENVFLQVDVAGGSDYKGAMVLNETMNLDADAVLTLHVTNVGDHQVPISIAIKTGEDWTYYESKPVTVPPAARDLEIGFDLQASTFKSQATKWSHRARARNLDQVREIQIQFHNQRKDATLYLDAIGFRENDGRLIKEEGGRQSL